MMEQEITKLKNIVGQLVSAIQGNELTGDGGISGRLNKLEKSNLEIKDEIIHIKDDNVVKNFQVKLLWAFAGALAALIVAYMFQVMFK